MARPLVIGIGNEHRGDDAAGLLAVRHLRTLIENDAVDIVEHGRDGASLIELWSGRSRVVLVDAVNAGGPPGRVLHLDASDTPLDTEQEHGSTHAFGPAGAIEMARCLDRLPEKVEIYGIIGNVFEIGSEAQPSVRAAAEDVALTLVMRHTSDRLIRAPAARASVPRDRGPGSS